MTTPSRFQIGSIIRTYRKQNHYTQEQLAELVNLTPGFLGQIERDETYPKLDNLAKMIQVLGIDANLLFYPERTQDTDLLSSEIATLVPKLSKANQECILYLTRKLMENQK